MKIKITIILLAGIFLSLTASAQWEMTESDIDPEYTKVLIKRVDKFLKSADLEDEVKYERVRDLVVHQYQGINWIEEQRNAQVSALREQEGLEKELMNARIDLIKRDAELEVFRLHTHFIAQLKTELSTEQIALVKDGMTYGVLDRTYGGYLNLLPKLTDEEKRYILTALLEARELAMDKGSSDAKHGTFGKYKGRINNYLSKRGYDLKQAEMELKQRQGKE